MVYPGQFIIGRFGFNILTERVWRTLLCVLLIKGNEERNSVLLLYRSLDAKGAMFSTVLITSRGLSG